MWTPVVTAFRLENKMGVILQQTVEICKLLEQQKFPKRKSYKSQEGKKNPTNQQTDLTPYILKVNAI